MFRLGSDLLYGITDALQIANSAGTNLTGSVAVPNTGGRLILLVTYGRADRAGWPGARLRAVDGGHVRGGGGRRSATVARPSARSGGPRSGVPADVPALAPGPAVADLVRARARADGTPRASGFGARPAPGDGGAARDTSPGAIRIRGRDLLFLVGIATDVSLHECRLPAGLTLCNDIRIGAPGPISLTPREGRDQWSTEDRAVSAEGRAGLGGACPGSGAGRTRFDTPRIAGPVRASKHGASIGANRTR
jgi:hypothetical protein